MAVNLFSAAIPNCDFPKSLLADQMDYAITCASPNAVGSPQMVGAICLTRPSSGYYTYCPDCPDTGDLPPDADPPFPPVYPYLFSTNDIYGRDNLSLNLKFVRGDSYSFNAAIILNGQPVDLTGGIVRMTAKWSVSDIDANAVFQLSSATSGITITSASAGEIRVDIPSSATTSLPAKKVELPFDIQFVNSLGKVFTVLYGTLVIVPDVTITA